MVDKLNFGNDLFADLEGQIDFTAALHAELDGILALDDNGNLMKTYQEIQAESVRFFSSPLVAADMLALESLATRYKDFCQTHLHGAQMEGTAESNFLGQPAESEDKHSDHEHDDEDDEDDEKNNKKRKSHTFKRAGRLALTSKH